MVDRQTKKTAMPSGIDTLIGSEMSITGNVTCAGTLRVQGSIDGSVTCEGSPGASLVVDRTGNITGTSQAVHVSVRGRIVGPLQSSQSVQIYSEGAVLGDISYRNIAIHAGGIIDGILSPITPIENSGRLQTDTTPACIERNSLSDLLTNDVSWEPWWRNRYYVLAVICGFVVTFYAWVGNSSHPTSSTERQTAQTDFQSSPPPPSLQDKVKPATPSADKETSPPIVASASNSSALPGTPLSSPERPAPQDEKIQSVKGLNSSRPPGVFLLVSNEASVLYRKKRGETGDGVRIPVSAGARISVSIAPDDLIRIAQGQDLTIYFQGQKVPQSAIESKEWINFVPK